METSVLGARAPGEKCCRLDGMALRFQERMSGSLGVGESDPRAGAARGARDGTPLSFDLGVRIEDLGRFLRGLDHPAALTGTVTFGPLGGTLPIRNGRFHLFDVNGTSGARQITYAFSFTAGDGKTYCLRGRKEVRDDPGALDVLGDMTTLFTTLHRGEDEAAPIHAAGLLRFDLALAPELIRSMRVEGASSLAEEVAARVAFTSFAYGVLRDEYLKDARLVYDTRYEVTVHGPLGAA